MTKNKNLLTTDKRHLEVVSQFAIEVLSLNSEKDVVWHLANNVVAELGLEDAVVYLFDERREVLVQAAAYGEKSPDHKNILNPIELELGRGVVGQVALSKRPLNILDTRKCDDYVIDDKIRLSELAVPLLDDDVLVGVLDSEHSEVGFFKEYHLKTLQAVASIAATKISQNRTLKKLQETINKLEYSSKIQDALFEIAELIFETDNVSEFYEQLHTKISGLTFAKNFFIALASNDGKTFSIPYCVDEVDDVPDNETTVLIDDPPSITGYVLRTNVPLLVYKEELGALVDSQTVYIKGSLPEAWLGVPFGNDSLRGIVVVQSYNSKFVFTEKDKLLLSFVAKHIRNAIERMQARSELTRLALHDPLTQLPNRILFNDRLERALIALERRKQSVVALLFLDLDKFKFINDKYGHHVGDLLLKACATRLKECVRESDTVCRIGGDEFAVLLENLDDLSNIKEIANKITKNINLPLQLEGAEVKISTSIGISFCDGKKKTPEKMFLEADSAMYQAKENGRSQVCFFVPRLGSEHLDSVDLESELKIAISEERLMLKFQPLVEMNTGLVVGGEALVRWQHPKFGTLQPTVFVNELERSKSIIELDQYVLRTAINHLSLWLPTLPDHFSHISVNVSGKGFNSQEVMEVLESTYVLNPKVLKGLCLELTERSIVSSIEQTRITMDKVRKMGVKIALDDFGTGYSSLSYLHQFNFDDLKIDKSFVSNYQRDSGKNIVLEAIVNLANSLGIQTTAEGIETRDQFEMMKALGCKTGQGFYMSKPVEENVFMYLLCEGEYLAKGISDN